MVTSGGNESAWSPWVGATMNPALMQREQRLIGAIQPRWVGIQRQVSAGHNDKEVTMVPGMALSCASSIDGHAEAQLHSQPPALLARTHPLQRLCRLGSQRRRSRPAAAAERTAPPSTAPRGRGLPWAHARAPRTWGMGSCEPHTRAASFVGLRRTAPHPRFKCPNRSWVAIRSPRDRTRPSERRPAARAARRGARSEP